MEWVYLLVGGVLVLLGFFAGSSTNQTATDRANKWAKGIDPDAKK